MPSQLKTDTARANGAKSRGPVTPEGRAQSSRNAVRHGLTAKSVVLPTESGEQFQLLLDSYIDQFHPRSDIEMELVETMAATRWRLRRICQIETNLLSTELVRRAEDIEEEFTDTDTDDRLAWVFQKLADNGQTLALLVRYEGALNRAYDRAFKQLNVLQHAAPAPAPQCPQQNEPTPDHSPRSSQRDLRASASLREMQLRNKAYNDPGDEASTHRRVHPHRNLSPSAAPRSDHEATHARPHPPRLQ